MCKNYCPYKEKCDVIRTKEESEKINLGSLTIPISGLVVFHS